MYVYIYIYIYIYIIIIIIIIIIVMLRRPTPDLLERGARRVYIGSVTVVLYNDNIVMISSSISIHDIVHSRKQTL